MHINPRLATLAEYPFATLAALRRSLHTRNLPVYDFSKGDPIEPTPAFIREAVGPGVPAVSQYPSTRGTLALREACAGYLRRRFKVTLDPETQIIQARGLKEAIYSVNILLSDPGSSRDIVVGPAPGFMVAERGAHMAGLTFHAVEVGPHNRFLLELDQLPREVLSRTAIAWINYPHNPTGATCDRSYLARQVRTAREHGIVLCSDECYVDMYLGETPHPSVLEVTSEGVLAFHSCSKRSGMTGYRSGFVAGDATLLKHFVSLRDMMGVETPAFIEAAAIAAWGDDQHVAERRAVFRAKRDLVSERLRRIGLAVHSFDATFYLWVEAPHGYTGEQYASHLARYGIVVTPGHYFGGEASAKFFRVALVPSLAESEQALAVWEHAHAQLGA